MPPSDAGEAGAIVTLPDGAPAVVEPDGAVVPIPPATITTIAGKNAATSGYADGNATDALFDAPEGLALDATGQQLYVADSNNHVVRHLNLATMKVTTVAGIGTVSGFRDTANEGTSSFVPAQLNTPRNLVLDPSGTSIYFTDTGNYVIRKLDLSNFKVTTLFGKPGVPGAGDGFGAGARFGKGPQFPWAGGMVIDASAAHPTMYVADSANQTIRSIDLVTTEVKTIAGQAGVAGWADAVGTSALFNKPNGVALDGAGHLYVVESNNIDIRKIDLATFGVTTVAGKAPGDPTHFCESISPVIPPECDWTDAPSGPDARFRFPFGVTLDRKGGMYIVDSHNDVVRHFDMTTTAVTTVAGVQRSILDDIPHASLDTAQGQPGTFWHPSHAVFLPPNVLFVADRSANCLRRVELGQAP